MKYIILFKRSKFIQNLNFQKLTFLYKTYINANFKTYTASIRVTEQEGIKRNTKHILTFQSFKISLNIIISVVYIMSFCLCFIHKKLNIYFILEWALCDTDFTFVMWKLLNWKNKGTPSSVRIFDYTHPWRQYFHRKQQELICKRSQFDIPQRSDLSAACLYCMHKRFH